MFGNSDVTNMALKSKLIVRAANAAIGCVGARISRGVNAFSLILFASFAMTIAGGAAQAQDVDWVVNIDDTGYDPLPAGGTIVYTVDVSNNGSDLAPATTMTFEIPVDYEFAGVTESAGGLTNCTPLSGAGPLSMTCDVPPLAQDVHSLIEINVLATTSGFRTVSASVPEAGDVLIGNNSPDEQTTTDQGADVAITINGPATAPAGGAASYDLVINNNGPDDVGALTYEFPVPTGFIVTSTPSGCSLSGATYTCSLPGTLANGTQTTVTFGGQVSAGDGSSITPVASVGGGDVSDPITDNNTDTTNTVVTPGSDVAIAKSISPSSGLLVGDTVTFTLSPTYTGDSPNGLTVTDVVPANYQIDSVTAPGWICPAQSLPNTPPYSSTLECTRTSGTIAGANVSLGDITIEATILTSGSAINTATITSDDPVDPNPGNNSDTDGGVSIATPVTDLAATKSGPDPALVVVGQEYDFVMSLENVGNTPYVGTITLTDNLPANMDANSASGSGWDCATANTFPVAGPGGVVCTRTYTSANPLPAGASTPAVTVVAEATASGVLVNTVTIDAPGDENGDNDSFDYTVTSQTGLNSADIRVVKTHLTASVVAGEEQTYTIEVINDGAVASENVTLTDSLNDLFNNQFGAGNGVVSFTENPGDATGLSCGTAVNGGRSRLLTCAIGSLPVCGAVGNPAVSCPTVDVTVRLGGNGGSRTNQARAISSTTPDPDLDNNLGATTFTVEPRADMIATKVATPDPAVAGQTVTYVITARNNTTNLSRADAVSITDTLPHDVTFLSATPSSGSCGTEPAANSVTGAGNDQLICSLGNINRSSQQTVTVVVRPNSVTQGTTITNDVVVATTTIETNDLNNDASVDVDVLAPRFDLLVNKVDDIDPVAVPDQVVYTVTVTNRGPSTAEAVTVIDTLPPALLSYQSHTESGAGTCAVVPVVGTVGGTLSCDFATIPALTTETITVTMAGVAKGVTTNSVTVTSPDVVALHDTVPANNTTTEETTVRTRADVEVTSKSASASPVNLREDFNFVIVVSNNTGPGLVEADDVEVTDTLPTGMYLTGAPTMVSSDTTANSCTGVAGETSFACDLGTFASGGTATITVPVEVREVTTQAQVLTNSATISTSSLDVEPDNDTNSGDVSVNSSSISGTVFRDFDADIVLDGGDTGIAGITMTLTGTSFDGQPITATATTDPSGNYTFPNLPEGDYQISRGTVSEPHLTVGGNEAGTEGGDLTSDTLIENIALPANTDAPEYLFTMVPTARIGIAKRVLAGPVNNADGSFNVTFRLLVENLSLEALVNVDVTDPLADPAPLFGSYVTLTTPATDPMAYGSYTMLTAPSGSCGGLNAGFDGNTTTTVASGFGLVSGGTCTVDFELRVRPTQSLPPILPSGGRFENQANVTGEGALSGQTSATNPELSDASHDGTNVDPDDSGTATEAGENDPTPVNPAITPSIALVKTADTSAFSDPIAEDDVVTYNFAITNTGSFDLTNVTLTDDLVGIDLDGDPIPFLAAGDTDDTTYSATYDVTIADLNAGEIVNQANVTGTGPFGTVVEDDSGTATDNDLPQITALEAEPSIALIKVADATAVQDPAQVGDIISYSFTITNTGNVTLTDVSLDDLLDGIVLVGGPTITLDPLEVDTDTFTATYALDQDDIDRGYVENLATATGTPPTGPDVTDDSGTDNDTDAPTITPVAQSASILLEKFVDDSAFETVSAQVGDTLPYTFTVTNTGNVTLTNVRITDPLLGVYDPITDTGVEGGPITLAPLEVDSTTFSGNYTLTPADIDRGYVDNTATALGDYVDGTATPQTVTDDSSVQATVASIEAVSEPDTIITTNGGVTTSMLASDSVIGEQATLANVTISVVTTDPELTLDTDTGLITLAPDNPAGVYTVEYEICSVAYPSICDTATETVIQAALPAIETVKSQTLTDNGDGIDGVGDTVNYVITVQNIGNVPLENLVLDDTFTGLDGSPLVLDSGPTFDAADQFSAEGDLLIGETATYLASYVLTIDAVVAGGVSNTVTATGEPIYPAGVPTGPTEVSDVSDDDIDSDGNTTDDPTELAILPSLEATGLTVEKTTPLGLVERGSVVPYTITVRNENPVVSGSLNIVDVLPLGFLYVEDSAMFEGAPYPVEVSGRVITWPSVPVPPLTTVTATISARVTTGAQSGDHVNTASVRDPGNDDLLAQIATATVRIAPEAVFDCGDVIGKVFDDRNRDGYQNEAGPRPITDSDVYVDGKLGVLPEIVQDNSEPGIPAVRLVGVDGTIITTDEFGRFHVPCAMLPDDRGSNFILKLDTRSLPAGFRMTTENPRVVRLTPGNMTEMNFGAAITRVARIDLNNAAFVAGDGGSAELAPGLVAGIEQLLPEIADEAVNLRLAFHLPQTADDDEVRRARRLMEMVEDHLRMRWDDIGQVKLTIEQVLVRAEQ